MEYTEIERKAKLHTLGRLVREHGEQSYKKHGNYWTLRIGYAYFFHDDYNRSVWFSNKGPLACGNLNNVTIYFGIDFGGFESSATDEQFDIGCDLLKAYDAAMNLALAEPSTELEK